MKETPKMCIGMIPSDTTKIKTKKSYYNIYEHLNKNSKDLFGHENTVLIQSV
jgi:hypothetical protein